MAGIGSTPGTAKAAGGGSFSFHSPTACCRLLLVVMLFLPVGCFIPCGDLEMVPEK